jgi:uncharacterized membrane protein YcgQ (UPF0703/DUF1980 family)
MTAIQIKAREFACAIEARQYASQFDGRAIRLDGRFYVVSEETAHELETKGARFAYVCSVAGFDTLVTVPVN